MTFGEKLRRARKEKGLTQAELANQAGLGLRTIIAYEKGETYPQKRSTYQTLADILGVQADDLHNEETATSAAPLSRAQWENAKQQYEKLLPDAPAWPGDPTYETYCEKMARSAGMDPACNYYKSTGQELPQITIRPALTQDFPTLLQICKDRYEFDTTRPGVDKSQLPTFESQLETLARSLVRWIAAGQCFLVEANGRPGAWFVSAAPRAGRLSRRQQTKRRREGNGLRAAAPRHHAGSLMQAPVLQVLPSTCSAFCQACCPRLAIEVPLDDPLSRFRLAYWLDQGLVPDTRTASGGAVCLVSYV